MNKFSLFLCLSCLCLAHSDLLAQEISPLFEDRVDRQVNKVIVDEESNTLYISGNFNFLGSVRNRGTFIDSETGSITGEALGLNGNIIAATVDESGGIYIAGSFSEIMGQPRSQLAYIDSNGNLSEFNSGREINGTIRELELIGDDLIISGFLSSLIGKNSTIYPNGVVVNTEDGQVSENLSAGLPATWVKAQSDSTGGFYFLELFNNNLFYKGFALSHLDAEGNYSLLTEEIQTDRDGFVRDFYYDKPQGKVYFFGNLTILFDPNNIASPILEISTIDESAQGIVESTDGRIRYLETDDNGDLLIAGDFSNINETSANGLARISPDGTISKLLNDFNRATQIRSIARKDSLLYITSGQRILQKSDSKLNSSNLNIIDEAGNLIQPLPRLPSSSSITEVLPDGNGGFYLLGTFNRIGDQIRTGLAHFNDKGILTNWDPKIIGFPKSIVANDTAVFIGGIFNSVNGVNERRYLVSIDKETAEADIWNPSISSSIEDMEIHNDTLYLGGGFFSVEGESRKGFAGIDLSSKLLIENSVNVEGFVSEIYIDDQRIFIAGDLDGGFSFQNLPLIGYDRVTNSILTLPTELETYRATAMKVTSEAVFVTGFSNNLFNNLYALDLNFENIILDRRISGTVDNMEVFNNKLQLSGSFSEVDGKSRINAFIDLETFQMDPQIPSRDGFRNQLRLSEGQYLKLASFASEFIVRNQAYAVNLDNGKLSTWDPSVAGNRDFVEVAKPIEGGIGLAGSFSQIDGQRARNFAIVDPLSGDLLNTYTQINRNIFDFIGEGNLVWFASQSQVFLFDKNQDQILWTNNVDRDVKKLLVKGDTLFALGSFNTINSQAQKGIFAMDKNTGTVIDWNAGINGSVTDAHIQEGVLYMTGSFTIVSGKARKNIAAIDLQTGEILPWDPTLSKPANFISSKNGNILVGEEFLQTNAKSIINVFSYDVNLNEIENFSLPEDLILDNQFFEPRSVLEHQGYLYLTIRKNNLSVLKRLNLSTQDFDSWEITFDFGGASKLLAKGDSLLIGGGFTSLNGQLRKNLAVARISDQAILPYNPAPDYRVDKMELIDNILVVSGRDGGLGLIDAYNLTTQSPFPLNFTSNIILGLTSKNDSIIFNGRNIEYQGKRLSGTFAYDINTGELNSFGPTPRTNLTKEYVSGNFYLAESRHYSNSINRQNLAAINITTDEVLDWSPNPLGNVFIDVFNDTLFVGGIYDEFATKLLAIDWDTKTLTNWEVSLSGTLYNINATPDWVYVSGNFLTSGGTTSSVHRFDRVSAARSTWGSEVSGQVVQIKSIPGEVLISGSYGGISANGESGKLFSLDLESGSTNLWSPNITGNIVDMEIHNDTLVLAGNGLSVDNSNLSSNLSYKISDKSLLDWSFISNTANLIKKVGNRYFVAGSTFAKKAKSNSLLTALNLTDGTVKDFPLSLNGEEITTIPGQTLSSLIVGDTIYLGGSYNLNGSIYPLLAINKNNGGIASNYRFLTNGVQNGFISDIQIYRDTLVLSGQFHQVNGIPSNNLALIDLSESVPLANSFVNLGNSVQSRLQNDTLHLTGFFPELYQEGKTFYQAYRISDNTALDLSLPLESEFLEFEIDDSHIYGIERNQYIQDRFVTINKYDKDANASLIQSIPTNHDYRNLITDMTIEGNSIYLKGVEFVSSGVDNYSKNLSLFDKNTGEELNYYNNLRNGELWDMQFSETYAFFGGRYKIGDSQNESYLSRMPLLRTWYADPDGDDHGDPSDYQFSFTQPEGYGRFAGDCTPNDPDVYPGAPALPDGKDNNCDGIISPEEELRLSSDQLEDQPFSIYPNPATETVRLQIDQAIRTINVYDSFGRWIEQWDAAESHSISHLPAGVYILKIQTGQSDLTGKLIKQ